MTTSSNTRTRIACALAASILVALLSACGGGGGGGASASAPVTPGPSSVSTVPVFAASNIVTTNFTSTYANAEDSASFALLNTSRSTCGFGTLAQNTHLDTAAKNHADWQLVNNYLSHYEEAINATTHVATIGFTGVNPSDRMVFAGYAANTGLFSFGDDFSTVSGTAVKFGMGSSNLRDLLNAPYHQRSLLAGYREVGISNRSSNDVNTTVTYGPYIKTQISLANTNSAGTQQPSSTDVLTYPCTGVTGTAFAMTAESPSVLASRDYGANPTGQPVYIMVREGQQLVITSASMNVTSSGAVVPLQPTLTKATDRNGIFASNDAMIIPDVALLANTSYTVAIAGTNSGQVFTRNFTFTTGL